MYAIVLISCLACQPPTFLLVTFKPECQDKPREFTEQPCREAALDRCTDWIIDRGMSLSEYQCIWRKK